MEPIRVLLADDQELFRSGVAATLSDRDDIDIVGQAGDGIEAVDLVGAANPDVVLMDIQMPRMDGVEATRRIFSPELLAGRTRPVRVIVLTTFNLDDRAATAIRLGASGFVLKDATPDFLVAAIRTVHAGNAVIAPAELTALLDGTLGVRAAPPASYLSLTSKEREVLREIALGQSNAEIGRRLFLSESTIKTHVSSILRKLRLRDRVQLVVYAYDHNLR